MSPERILAEIELEQDKLQAIKPEPIEKPYKIYFQEGAPAGLSTGVCDPHIWGGNPPACVVCSTPANAVQTEKKYANKVHTLTKFPTEDWEEHGLTTRPKPQVGGEHYAQAIEPLEYIEANEIPFHEANVIKYISRWKKKNGLQDLEKAKWYIDRLIEQETSNE